MFYKPQKTLRLRSIRLRMLKLLNLNKTQHTEQRLIKSMLRSRRQAHTLNKTQSLVWKKLNSIFVLFMRLIKWRQLNPLGIGVIFILKGALYATT
jgi:hypothetical protein